MAVSERYIIDGRRESISAALQGIERFAHETGLTGKPVLHLRLLAEELTGMLPRLVKVELGEIWAECEGSKYLIRVCLLAARTGSQVREQLLSISSAGSNAAAVGIMGKIRDVVQALLDEPPPEPQNTPTVYIAPRAIHSPQYMQWSLSVYKQQVLDNKEHEEAWDELEKSIVAKIADDVTVGIKGRNVEITAKKAFLNSEAAND